MSNINTVQILKLIELQKHSISSLIAVVQRIASDMPSNAAAVPGMDVQKQLWEIEKTLDFYHKKVITENASIPFHNLKHGAR